MKATLAREIVRDVLDGDLVDRVDHDMAVVQWIFAADFDLEPLPDANARFDSAAADAITQLLREDHVQPRATEAAESSETVKPEAIPRAEDWLS
ncbi:MAG TPA: hypothetical protein VM096_06000 [Vicinamibacterales bacterium]|nr:hypothetical protein [Vicinamibacterales bacterium]